jgi:hypothetical protein
VIVPIRQGRRLNPRRSPLKVASAVSCRVRLASDGRVQQIDRALVGGQPANGTVLDRRGSALPAPPRTPDCRARHGRFRSTRPAVAGPRDERAGRWGRAHGPAGTVRSRSASRREGEGRAPARCRRGRPLARPPPALAEPRRAPTADQYLDRADLSPPPTATPPRTAHPGRVRDTHPRRVSGLTTHPTSQLKSGQSRSSPQGEAR